MLMKWIRILLLIVILTAVIGFTGMTTAQPFLNIVRGIFAVFLVIFVVTVFVHISRDKD
ncbi:MAG: hypothetical protein K0R48_1117 [Gammaproteobacteria bacterium]|jgi:uncharacterized membrane protein YtjA (UPF0391 family)|nr:hypothetical protein [Gammaproteobacteria bacterium]